MAQQSTQDPALQKKRVAVYFDGFNMYYPIDESGKHYLKWVCLRKLASILASPHQGEVVRVVFCTAVPSEQDNRWIRHTTYNNVLRANNVDILLGHHVIDENGARAEKQTDLNLGLSVICDANDDIFDIAFIVSADSDQAATARFLRERHPNKMLYMAAPWGLKPPNKASSYATGAFTISEETLEKAVMPQSVQGRTALILRPAKYDPPADWVHPEDRFKSKSKEEAGKKTATAK